jgi:hypothetical protein
VYLGSKKKGSLDSLLLRQIQNGFGTESGSLDGVGFPKIDTNSVALE